MEHAGSAGLRTFGNTVREASVMRRGKLGRAAGGGGATRGSRVQGGGGTRPLNLHKISMEEQKICTPAVVWGGHGQVRGFFGGGGRGGDPPPWKKMLNVVPDKCFLGGGGGRRMGVVRPPPSGSPLEPSLNPSRSAQRNYSRNHCAASCVRNNGFRSGWNIAGIVCRSYHCVSTYGEHARALSCAQCPIEVVHFSSCIAVGSPCGE